MSLKTRTRADYHYFLPYRTRWSDNDQYGHLNNSVYNLLVDSIVNAYLISNCGLRPSSSEDDDSPIGLVITSSTSYFAPISFPAVVDLGLRVDRIGTSSVVYEVGFFVDEEEDTGAVRAVGGFTHVFVDRRHRRPVHALGAEMRAGLERLLVREGAKL